MRYLLIMMLMVSLAGCDVNVNPTVTVQQPAAQTTSAPVVATVSPSPAPATSTNCWNNYVKTNGAAYAAYATASRAAGNTWYACYGHDAQGNEKGIWLGFYDNGKMYYGIPDTEVMDNPGTNNASCSNFVWKNGSTVLGYADDATLDSHGALISIELANYVNGAFEPLVNYTCHVEQ